MTTNNNETDIMVAATESTNDNGISMAAITSSVNNPYTFSITKNVTFSAICEEDWSGGGK